VVLGLFGPVLAPKNIRKTAQTIFEEKLKLANIRKKGSKQVKFGKIKAAGAFGKRVAPCSAGRVPRNRHESCSNRKWKTLFSGVN